MNRVDPPSGWMRRPWTRDFYGSVSFPAGLIIAALTIAWLVVGGLWCVAWVKWSPLDLELLRATVLLVAFTLVAAVASFERLPPPPSPKEAPAVPPCPDAGGKGGFR